MIDRFTVAVMNYAAHKDELSNAIYRLEGDNDIALVLHEITFDPGAGLSAKIADSSSIESADTDLDTIWEDAFKNTCIIAPPRMHVDVFSLEKPDPTKGAFMEPECELKIKFEDVPVITTTKFDNGSIAMFYPGVRDRIAEMAGKSYYVSFTSVNEARIHVQGSKEPSKIQEMLLDVNARTDKDDVLTKKDDVLTKKVYFYNAKTKEFTASEYNTGS